MSAARRLLPLLAGLSALVALVGGLVLGRGMASGGERVDDPVSIGFARDMNTHHAQAVAMSEIVHRRSTDKDINYLAFDIMTTQQGQIGMMSGWLDVWGQSQSNSGPAMAWMGEPHDGPMPGTATPEEIEELDQLPVADMHEQYLRLLIRHHRGAIDMADDAAANATEPLVARLAGNISAGQESEIDFMQGLLAQRGFAPEPDDGAADHDAGHDQDSTPAPMTSHSSH